MGDSMSKVYKWVGDLFGDWLCEFRICCLGFSITALIKFIFNDVLW